MNLYKSEEDKRQITLDQGNTVFLEAPELGKLRKQLLPELFAVKSDGYGDLILQKVFSRKTASALANLANHLLGLFDLGHKSGSRPLSLSEETFYRFLRGALAPLAPTAPKSSRESISFAELVGFDGAASILDGKRIRGVCRRLELTEGLTREAKEPHDLFAVSGRLSWKGSQWLSRTMVEKNAFGTGYLNCDRYVTKTSTTAKKKTTMLLVAVPIRLLETSDSASKFLPLREKLGLPDIGVWMLKKFMTLRYLQQMGESSSLISRSPHRTQGSGQGSFVFSIA